MKKRFILPLCVFLLAAVLAVLAKNPIVQYKVEVPESYHAAIEGQAQGIYSNQVPLVPVYVRVTRYEEPRAFYTIYYFPFGTVGMSYANNDGYNCEKYLTGW